MKKTKKSVPAIQRLLSNDVLRFGICLAIACGATPAPAPDSDSDGVADAEDRCPRDPGPASEGGCPPLPDETEEAPFAILDVIEFDPETTQLSGRTEPILDAVAETLLGNPEVQVDVRGHTTAEEREELAIARAEAIRGQLMLRGVNGERIQPVALVNACPGEPRVDFRFAAIDGQEQVYPDECVRTVR